MEAAANAGADAVAEARDVILFLAPGFLALKFFQIFGAQRKRSEWEWTAWSILLAAAIGALFVPEWRLAIGVIAGIVAALVWRNLSRLPFVGGIGAWLHRDLSNSAWDLVLDTASAKGRWVEVELGDPGKSLRFRGSIAHFAYEQYEAEPWLYITEPQRSSGTEDDFEQLSGTWGVMVHKANIKWLRVTEPQS